MRPEILWLALLVGACNWLFRYVPTMMNLHRLPANSVLMRLLGATGPAAIGTLFVASVMPLFDEPAGGGLVLAAGLAAVCLTFAWTRSVVMATIAGAVAYGLCFWLAVPAA